MVIKCGGYKVGWWYVSLESRGMHWQLPTYGVGGEGGSRWLIQISFHKFKFEINPSWSEHFGVLE